MFDDLVLSQDSGRCFAIIEISRNTGIRQSTVGCLVYSEPPTQRKTTCLCGW